MGEREIRKNIVIITPFYPIVHRTDLNEDTKAVYYLLKNVAKNNNILIVHSFLHSCRTAYKNFLKIFPLSNNYKDYLHNDGYGNKVLFFENIFFVPKRDYICEYFNSKYAHIVDEFCKHESYWPDLLVVHFPTYYEGFLRDSNVFTKKIAVLHAVDIKKIKNQKNKDVWTQYFNSFDAIGFRSHMIKRQFEQIIEYNKNTFLCMSGIPENYLNSEFEKIGFSHKTTIKLIYAGRIDKNKNLNGVIEALNLLKSNYKYEFNIIGEGKTKKSIEKLVNKLNMNYSIKLLGSLNRETVFHYMKESDIFIMVSHKETLGLVYLEAMAAGCIVIGTKGQGIDGILIDGENGFLTDSNNINSIKETIQKVICLSADEQLRIRQKAKQTVKGMGDTELSKLYYKNICSVL